MSATCYQHTNLCDTCNGYDVGSTHTTSVVGSGVLNMLVWTPPTDGMAGFYGAPYLVPCVHLCRRSTICVHTQHALLSYVHSVQILVNVQHALQLCAVPVMLVTFSTQLAHV